MAELLTGAPVAAALTEKLIPRIAALAERGVTPKLAILRVGAREDDLSYERAALKRCAALGIDAVQVTLDLTCSQDELMAAIGRIN
ncbi:MAG TPA: tetrahydrofolate dehydrogenase/cyclohydrolase catalytic domain-containing protein, partial [Atopobiaceae bacterium]|nr:tetrahydrofolate dehydrogenase/cyclohydrolase catalytic domain-containing protein [Atopobiaceae bacterium]